MIDFKELLKSGILAEGEDDSKEVEQDEDLDNPIKEMLVHLYGEESLDEDGEFIDPKLSVISEMSMLVDEDYRDDMLEILDYHFGLGLFDNDEEEVAVPDEYVGTEVEDDEESMDEGVLTQKERRMRAIKAKKKKMLGQKATTVNFKRNFYFDRTKRKFVKRDNALSVTTLRKKAKRFKKIIKKSSVRAKIQRTKKRVSHMAKIAV